MKIIGALLACILSFSSFAGVAKYSNCAQAIPNSKPGFCASFEQIARCHCAEHIPAGCNSMSMNTLYSLMVKMHGSLEKACAWQKDTPTQNCIDNWICFRNGGKNSQGDLCSSTGKSCQ